MVRTSVLACAASLAACSGDAVVALDALAVDASLDAPAVDASLDAPLDASSAGRLLVSWRFYREGVADPTVTCAELDAQTAMIIGGVGVPGVTVPCDQHFILLEQVPPQTLDLLLLIVRANPDGSAVSRVGLRPAAPVTVTAGATTYVPLELRLFDEPYPQLQQIFDGAAAFYAASPDPKAFPSGEPGYAGCGGCADPTGICAPDPARWTAPPFSQLGFTVPGPSRFTYDFHAQGSGPTATFTITASADYDCDTAQRRFTIHGSVASDGTVVGAATIVVDDND